MWNGLWCTFYKPSAAITQDLDCWNWNSLVLQWLAKMTCYWNLSLTPKCGCDTLQEMQMCCTKDHFLIIMRLQRSNAIETFYFQPVSYRPTSLHIFKQVREQQTRVKRLYTLVSCLMLRKIWIKREWILFRRRTLMLQFYRFVWTWL